MSSNEKKKSSEAPDPSQIGRDLALDLFNLSFLVVLVGIFFLDVILRGQVFFAGDVMNVYSPWQIYNQEALVSGRMPLWCDDFFMGFPLFAESQGALFYPPTRLVYFLAPNVNAFSFDVLLHFLMAGWFQYFFARTLKLSPPAALMSAVAFAFSGLFLSLPINFTIFRSIVWIPLVFMFLTMAARRRSLIFPLLAAVSLVFQMMGGSLNVTWITGLALVPYVIFLILSPGQGKQSSLVPLLQLVLTILLAAGLYCFQLVPTLELMIHAWRGTEAGYDVASAFSFPPEHFIDVILPTFYGVWAEGSMLPARIAANFFPYMGLAPLLLVLPSFGSRKRGVFILFVMVILALALAVGKYGLVYPTLYPIVPLIDKFRAPDRFWIIAIFAGTLMAGYGLERMVSSVETDKRGYGASTAGLLATIILLIVLFFVGALYTPVVQGVWREIVNSMTGLVIGGGRAGLDQAVYERWQVHLAAVILHALVVIAAFHCAIAMFGRKGRGGALAGTLILITVVDLYFMSFHVPALRTTGREFFTDPPMSAQVLRRDGEPNRFYSFLQQYYARDLFKFDLADDTVWYNGGGSNDISDYMEFREELSSNIFMHWGLQSSNGFASLFLASAFDLEHSAKSQLSLLLKNMPPEALLIPEDAAGFDTVEWSERPLLVDLMASRYILSPVELVRNGRFSVTTDAEYYSGPMHIYRNNRAFPRAWIARPESVLAETPDTLRRLAGIENVTTSQGVDLMRLTEPGIDPTRELILDPLPIHPRTFSGENQGRATAVIRTVGGAAGARARGGAIIDELVYVETSSPEPAYLLLADTFYPGWHAKVDGGPVDVIYRAFGYFRAIEIPAGDHLVEFYYQPESFNVGMTLSKITLGVAVLLLILQLVFFARAQASKPVETSSTAR